MAAAVGDHGARNVGLRGMANLGGGEIAIPPRRPYRRPAEGEQPEVSVLFAPSIRLKPYRSGRFPLWPRAPEDRLCAVVDSEADQSISVAATIIASAVFHRAAVFRRAAAPSTGVRSFVVGF